MWILSKAASKTSTLKVNLLYESFIKTSLIVKSSLGKSNHSIPKAANKNVNKHVIGYTIFSSDLPESRPGDAIFSVA